MKSRAHSVFEVIAIPIGPATVSRVIRFVEQESRGKSDDLSFSFDESMSDCVCLKSLILVY